MLLGTAPDAPTVDKAVALAKQFGPDVINSMPVLQPQQVMLEVRFIEANRQAGRELGVQWNVFNDRFLSANLRQSPISGAIASARQRSAGPNVASDGDYRSRQIVRPQACSRAPRRSASWSAS